MLNSIRSKLPRLHNSALLRVAQNIGLLVLVLVSILIFAPRANALDGYLSGAQRFPGHAATTCGFNVSLDLDGSQGGSIPASPASTRTFVGFVVGVTHHYPGGTYYSGAGNPIVTGNAVTAADIGGRCPNLSNITITHTDGANGPIADENYIGIRFTATDTRDGKNYLYEAALSGKTGTQIIARRTVLEPDFHVVYWPSGVFVYHGDTNPTSGKGTLFSDTPVNTTAGRLFRLGNWSANTVLNIGAITIIGPDADQFQVSGGANQTVNSLKAGNSDLTVTFNPTSTGTKNATISIVNDDPDKNPYTFAIRGTGTAHPEINVKGAGISILNGDLAPATNDGTNFGFTGIAGGTIAKTFTIENTGTGPLTISSATIGGTHAGDFTITSAPAATVAAGSSTTVGIQFDPSALGTRNATLNITNDDLDEPRYSFAIQGTGVDNVPPTVAITGVPATSYAAFGATFTFSEAITGFTQAEIRLSNATASNFTAVSSTVYTANIMPTSAGAVTIDIASGVAQDGAGNGNTAATQATSTYVTRPTIQILGNGGVMPHNQTAGAILDHRFFSRQIGANQTKTFVIKNIGTAPLNLGTLTNNSTTHFTITQPIVSVLAPGAQTTFTVRYEPPNPGYRDSVVSIPSDSHDKNPFLLRLRGHASNTLPSVSISGDTLVRDGQTATLTANASDINSPPQTLTYQWSQTAGPVTVTIGNATSAQATFPIPALTGGATTATYTFKVVVSDGVGSRSRSRDVIVDGTAPTVSLGALTATGNGSYTSAITLSEAAGNGTVFDQSDLALTNATGSLSGSGTSFTATLTPSSDGLVGLAVTAAAFQDAAGNDSTAAAQVSVTHDATSPTVAITGVPATSSAPYTATFTFSEAVTGFAVGDISLTNAAASAFAGSGTTYTALITPAADGAVTVNVAAGVAQDGSGNNNTAATQASSTHDATSPTVTLSGPTGRVTGEFTVTITFNEDVTGFAADDLVVTNGTVVSGSFSGSGKDYTVRITPTTMGQDVTVKINAAAAKDAASKDNVASKLLTIRTGSVASEFEDHKEDFRNIIRRDAEQPLRVSLRFNQGLMRDARDRFRSSANQMAQDLAGGFAGQNDLPFDVVGSAQVQSGMFFTAGTFFGQDGSMDGTYRRMVFGDFDLQRDKDGSTNATVNSAVAWEYMASERVMYGYYLGLQVSRSDIDSSFTGTRDGFGGSAGAYVVAEPMENLFADGFVAFSIGQNELDMTNGTLSLESDYMTRSALIGGGLSGVITRGNFEFLPEISMVWGKVFIGGVDFTGKAYGLTNNTLTLDAGDITLASLTLRPEMRYTIGDHTQGKTRLSFAPWIECSRVNSVSDCSQGGEIGIAYQSGNGLTSFNAALNGGFGSNNRASLTFDFEHKF